MALYTLRSGATAHPEDSVLQLATDLIRVGGVLDLGTDLHFNVTEKGAGADMSVDIDAGRLFIKGSSGNTYPVRNTDTINEAIGSNTSGNPRKDAVVIYIDLAESPTSTADDVAKIAIVEGTPAASPSAPDSSAIQTAVGGSNPWLRLANVTVAHNETEITDAEIEDTRVQFVTKHMLNASSLAYSANLDIDVGLYNDRDITLTGNLVIDSITGYTTGVPFILRFIQNGTGGYTVDFSAISIDWFGGTPTVTATANKKDAFLFIPRSNGRLEGFIMGQDANIS
jgi:hypothetical protein